MGSVPQLAPHVGTSLDPMVQTVWQILRIDIKKLRNGPQKNGEEVGPKKIGGDSKGQVYVQVKFGDDIITEYYVMN